MKKTCTICKRSLEATRVNFYEALTCRDGLIGQCNKSYIAHRSDYRVIKKTHSGKGYNITVQEYDQMEKKQGGLCAICGQMDRRRLSIDHCHTTGEIRGLLCSNCNTGLGFFKDDRDTLAKAITYLK